MKIGIISVPEVSLSAEILKGDRVKRVLVQKPGELVGLDALILVGNDVFIMENFLRDNKFIEPIRKKVTEKMPVLGLGAGLWIMSETLNLMDVVAVKKGFCTNFTTSLYIPAFGYEPVISIFDHSPYIIKVEPHVGIMACYQEKIIMARQGNLLASAFFVSKEEKRLENYFLQMISENLE